MRSYFVDIVAEGPNGEVVKFVYTVVYPFRPADSRGITSEAERERDAIKQVYERMPFLKNVRATGSIHV